MACQDDQYAHIPWLLSVSHFWRIGVDSESRVLDEWKNGPLTNHHLKRWFKLLQKKRGGAAFHQIVLEASGRDIYLQLGEKISYPPRFLSYGNPLEYQSVTISGGAPQDPIQTESILKHEGGIFSVWRDLSPPNAGDKYIIGTAGAVGRFARNENSPTSQE